MANERLRALEDVEKEIAMILQCAGNDITHQMSFSFTSDKQLEVIHTENADDG